MKLISTSAVKPYTLPQTIKNVKLQIFVDRGIEGKWKAMEGSHFRLLQRIWHHREHTVSVGLGMIQSILEYLVYNGTSLLPNVDSPPFGPCYDYLVGNVKQHGVMVTVLRY